MSKQPCLIHITTEEWEEIQKHEAVFVYQLETSMKMLIAQVMAWGTLEEMEAVAKRSEYVIVRNEYRLVGQDVITVEFLKTIFGKPYADSN